MTIREIYTGLYDKVALFQNFQFLSFNQAVKIDKIHDRIKIYDPDNSANAIVIDTHNLDAKNGMITDGTITDVHLVTKGKDALTVTGLSIDATELNAAVMNGASALYTLLTENLHGTLIARGDKYDNILEVGSGGKATVDAGAGNDLIDIWHQKNAVIDGGKGTDSIEFYNYAGAFVPADGVARVDLQKGTGTNPFGGTLAIENVENVINMFNGSSDLRGDGHANYLRGGASADTLMGRGGDDIISVRQNFTVDPRATIADGGAGKDTLQADMTEGPGAPTSGTGATLKFFNVLNIDNADKNTGTFHGGVYRNFETFQVYGDLTREVFQFTGSNNGETVLSSTADDTLNGRGGNDVLNGSTGADRLIGGKGADHFQYQSLSDSTVAAAGRDTIADFSHAQHDRIDLSPIFASLNFGGAYDFIGGKKFDGHSSEVRFEHHGSDTLVMIDDNGDKTADFEILLDGHLNLVKGDFML
jgi:serralysin